MQHIPRIYQNLPLTIGNMMTIDEEKSHQMMHVLRMKIGDPFVIFNGKGGEYSASIQEISKKQIAAKIHEFQNISRESPLQIHLGQGISRGERMEIVLQKAVELGVHIITPLLTDYCSIPKDKTFLSKRMARWEAIMIHACEQSGRTVLPILNAPTPLKNWIAETHSDLSIILHPNENNHLKALTESTLKNIRVLIGPEGGFSESEVTGAQHQHFKAISLGKRILRTETAAISILSVLQYRWGDLQ